MWPVTLTKTTLYADLHWLDVPECIKSIQCENSGVQQKPLRQNLFAAFDDHWQVVAGFCDSWDFCICRDAEDFVIVHSGGGCHANGVAPVLMKSFAESVHSGQPISDRLITARLTHKHGDITVIVAYAPTATELADASDKDVFYGQLSSLVQENDTSIRSACYSWRHLRCFGYVTYQWHCRSIWLWFSKWVASWHGFLVNK